MQVERDRPPVRVFLTVDTEIWPRASGWPHVPLPPGKTCERERAVYFWGGETRARRGLPYQLETLGRHGLRATYFVDPLFSRRLGAQLLADVVAVIAGAGQEIGLHLHPEWLTDPGCQNLPKFAGPLLHQYSEEAQGKLCARASSSSRTPGHRDICAFRAGWGPNAATLRLWRPPASVDSSMNAYTPCRPGPPGLRRIQPRCSRESGSPVTFFVDRLLRATAPSPRAPSQSYWRARRHRAGSRWSSSTASSCARRRPDRADGRAGPAAARLASNCALLSRHRERFTTSHFGELGTVPIRRPEPGALQFFHLRSPGESALSTVL
jgi:hypothetical protein